LLAIEAQTSFDEKERVLGGKNGEFKFIKTTWPPGSCSVASHLLREAIVAFIETWRQ
jgi:hypothetical protein